MSTARRSAEEAVSALTLQLAQAEADTAAAVLKQQQAQASGRDVCGIPPNQTWLKYSFFCFDTASASGGCGGGVRVFGVCSQIRNGEGYIREKLVCLFLFT